MVQNIKYRDVAPLRLDINNLHILRGNSSSQTELDGQHGTSQAVVKWLPVLISFI